MNSALKKQDCPIKIKLTPCGNYYLHVAMDIQGDHLEYMPASSVGKQFGAVISALYSLFYEHDDNHREWRPHKYVSNEDHTYTAVSTVEWDNEGNIIEIIMSRKYEVDIDYEKDLIEIEIKNYDNVLKRYTVQTRDLCYAVAKACTDVLKEYGFYGYRYSTKYDFFKLHQLLYIKSFALLNFEARELTVENEKEFVDRTSFEKEMELLLFDM